MADKQELSDAQIIKQNWDRYEYGKTRGHDNFIDNAKENEDFYLGGGLQWKEEDRSYLESLGRPVIEQNTIFPAVNTAIGMQLSSRADIAFKPRGGTSDEGVAEVLSKVAMQICDDIKYQWLESQVFADGMIMQRGYLDFRMDFDVNMQGKVSTEELDPMDVIPDPDAKSYDPKKWQDVIVLRWMTIDDIAELYGEDKREKIELIATAVDNTGGEEDYDKRSKFGELSDVSGAGDIGDDETVRRFLVIDRQHKKVELEKVLVTDTGEIQPCEGMDQESVDMLIDDGAVKTKRMVRKVRWTVTTADIVLHDNWSPYDTFTVIPFFPYFRRGRTRGMVDNAKSPQELHNRSLSQYLHIFNTSANSGWTVEENSLSNMETPELEDYGAKTGLVLEYKKGSTPPQKIQPNQMPQGIDRLIDRTEMAIKSITGMSDAQQGLNGPEVSGVAIQSKQYMGQAQLSGPLDNLARTRHLVAEKLLELVQNFYTEERLILITDTEVSSMQPVYNPLVINQETPEGEVVNDLTIGEYDVVITDMPTQATFQDNQFAQAMEMRDKGIQVPDPVIIEMSSLTKKHEIAKNLVESAAPPPDPLEEAKTATESAKVGLIEAQTEKTKNEAVNSAVDALYSAMQSANVIATTPQTAPLGDKLLRSAGFEDQDAAPIVPSFQGLPAPLPPQDAMAGIPPNTNPTTPVPPPSPESPAEGANAGIETQRTDGEL